MENPQTAKAKLRQEIRSRLKALAPEKRAADSARVRSLLEQQALWKNARTILFFAQIGRAHV